MSAEATFDIEKLRFILEHDNHDTRAALKELFKDELYTPRYAIPLEEERRLAYERLKKICEGGHISVTDFINNPHRMRSSSTVLRSCRREQDLRSRRLADRPRPRSVWSGWLYLLDQIFEEISSGIRPRPWQQPAPVQKLSIIGESTVRPVMSPSVEMIALRLLEAAQSRSKSSGDPSHLGTLRCYWIL